MWISNKVMYLVCLALALGSQISFAASLSGVTAVADVFGEGTRLTEVVLRYDEVVDGRTLSLNSYRVPGQTIKNVYTSQNEQGSAVSEQGAYVVLAIDSSKASALIYSTNPQFNPSFSSAGKMAADNKAAAQSQSPADGLKAPAIPDFHVKVIQKKAIKTVGQQVISPSGKASLSDRLVNLSADRFSTYAFVDPKTGKTLKYNLYVPKGFDPQDEDQKTSYPLVFFAHDAGANSTDPRVTLWQGLGATVWASDANQLTHPSFVLAPQYGHQIMTGQSETTDAPEITAALIRYLQKQYPIDSKRIYATGQSGGCMLSITMNIQYPDLFAASFLVAGQWDAQKMSVLHDKSLWIVVSQGDLKAYPSMNEATKVMVEDGGKLVRSEWNGTADAVKIQKSAKEMLLNDANIRYVILKQGTVVPQGQTDDSGSNHLNTWRLAYTFQPIIDWLFTQHL